MKHFTLLISALLITQGLFAQANYLDTYIGAPVTLTTIGSSTHQVNQPRDLDFRPNSNDLWICNYGNSGGGTNVIFFDAGLPSQTSQFRKDSHSGHFLIYPSAMAFGDNAEWAGVSEIQNTAGPTSTFMGPGLWLADTNIFAKVFQNNWLSGYPLGSHIDMLHQSPFAMGIAHDSAKVYWVMDGYNGNIVKYDYVTDHGPGYDDHSAGKIWRYIDVPVTRVAGVPSHMVLDKENDWLYYIDGISKTLRRMNTSTGSVTGTLNPPATANEPLAGYWKVEGATVEVIDTFTTQICGVDYYNDRLIVSDFTNGDIYIYSTAGTVTLLGTIVTGQPGMMGVKVGPDGRIWCVNYIDSKVYRLESVVPVSDAALTEILSPVVENDIPGYFSTAFNVCDGTIAPSVVLTNSGSADITTAQLEYTIDNGTPVSYTWNGIINAGQIQNINLPATSVGYGEHLLSVAVISVNGNTDEIEGNNIVEGAFRVFTPVQSPPYTEDFTSNVFPPANWSYVSFNPNNSFSRQNVSSFGVGSGSLRMDNYSGPMNITGQLDHLMLPLMDFSPIAGSIALKFDVAYAKYDASSVDALKVNVSEDCGNTWTEMYIKAGTVLSTAPLATGAFTPTAAQWRTDSVNLDAFIGQPELMIMFTAESNYGNNLYIDNVKIDFTTSIKNVNSPVAFEVFPNPASSELNIQMANGSHRLHILEIRDVTGRLIYTENFTGQPAASVKKISLDQFNPAPGLLIVSVADGEFVSYKKVMIE